MTHNNQPHEKMEVTMQKLIPAFILAAAFVLSACGGGASNSAGSNPNGNGNTGTGTVATYDGERAQNDDTTNFQLQFWDNVRADNRCGSCHGTNGSAGSDFANNDDVNDAYGVAIGLVDANDIPNSAFARKFTGSGHFCWEGTQNACKIQIELWINNWLNGSSSASGRSITLSAPNDEAPAATVSFPDADDLGAGYTTLHNLVQTNCSGCHVPNPTLSAQPINPQFAVSTASDSYNVAKAVPLINLTSPTQSRFYTRLADDGHRCWDALGNGISCTDSATVMLAAINTFIAGEIGAVDDAELDSMLKSRAVQLFEDGIIAAGGNRYEANKVAVYEFKTGTGNTILDVSGVSPQMNLTLSGVEDTDFTWLGSYGVQFNTYTAKAYSDAAEANKLHQMVTSTGEYSIEAWVVPASVAQENKAIVSYEDNANNRNFMFGQDMYQYELFNRNNSTQTMADGAPVLETDGDDDAQTALQHVVVTYDQINGRRLYVNGTLRSLADPTTVDDLSNWSTDYTLVVGNDTAAINANNGKGWNGSMRLLAVHSRALTLDQIRQNFDAGVGQKYYLMFDISEHLPECQGPDPDPAVDNLEQTPNDYAPLCFVYLEAAQFDNTSFLFAYPRIVTLDDTVDLNDVRIRNMRIGINGREASNGQGFANIDVTINNFDPEVGFQLSDIGTIVAFENGPAGGETLADKLFLTFEQIDSAAPTKNYAESFPDAPDQLPAVAPTVSEMSVRNFEQINVTMETMTTVARTTDGVNQNSLFDGTNADNDGTYIKVIQALPGSTNPNAYAPSHQIAVTQMAIEYCNALVEGNGNTTPRDTYFPITGQTFNNLTQPVLDFTTGNTANQDLIIDPLLTRVLNYDGSTDLDTMPNETDVKADLRNLMGTLQGTCTDSAFECTQKIIKSTCAAAVASSTMLLF